MPVDKAQIAAEIKRRTDAMGSLIGFTQYTFPTYSVNWHHKAIAEALDEVLAGRIKRLMLFTPPRHGKSELVSKRFPAYALGKNPDLDIISTSYSDDLARVANRDVQRIILGAQYPLIFPNTKIGGTRTQDGVRNSDEFEVVGRMGLYKSAGIMGGITGRGFSVGIIDDPIKDRLEADSPTYRERLWEWYNAVFFTRRANDDAAIILVQTRWHHGDLAGRLLKQDAGEWTVIKFEALKEEEGTSQPLQQPAPEPNVAKNNSAGIVEKYDLRHFGEALWPDLFNAPALKAIEKQLGAFNFAALYQQRPVPRSGKMFKTEKIQLVEVVPWPLVVRSIRYWDKAGSVGTGCLTAGVLLHEQKDGTFLVGDVSCGQWGALERETHMLQTARLDGRRVKIWCEQEPGSGGKESAENTVRNLRGFVVNADKVTGDKVSRAEPYAAQVEAGNVLCLNRAWTKDYLDELGMYPAGAFLDRTDASAGAFNKLMVKRITPHAGSDPRPEEKEREVISEFEDLLSKAKDPAERAALEAILKKELVTA